MTHAPAIALLQSMTLPGDPIAEWVHLLPAGVIATQDGRGPYRLEDAERVITDSLHGAVKLPIDENHAIDLAAPRGEGSPARGWIVEMQARADGIWGRVEWTEAGRQLIADRAYLALSPVIAHDATKKVLGILRASLVNRPNLRGLTALHQQQDQTMNELLAKLKKMLGLADTAEEDDIWRTMNAIIDAAAAEKAKAASAGASATALQAQLSQIGTALGVPEGATAEAILAGARGKAAGSTDAVVALQAELATVATQLNQVRDASARSAAEAFVDGAIRRGTTGVKPLREHYIAMHMADAARVEKEIGAMPVLGPSNTLVAPPVAAGGEIALQSEHRDALRLGGFDAKAYAAVLKSEQEEAL